MWWIFFSNAFLTHSLFLLCKREMNWYNSTIHNMMKLNEVNSDLLNNGNLLTMIDIYEQNGGVGNIAV